MEITEIRVFPVDEDKLRGYASIVFDDCFIVNDLKIIQGKKGLFISMPSRRRKRGGYRDVAHPLNNETRDRIESLVIAEYRRAVGEETVEDEAGIVAAEPTAPADGGRPPGAVEDEAEPESGPPPAVDPSPEAPALAATGTEPEAETQGTDGGRRDAERADASTLEEVEQRHLRDSFWSVS